MPLKTCLYQRYQKFLSNAKFLREVQPLPSFQALIQIYDVWMLFDIFQNCDFVAKNLQSRGFRPIPPHASERMCIRAVSGALSTRRQTVLSRVRTISVRARRLIGFIDVFDETARNGVSSRDFVKFESFDWKDCLTSESIVIERVIPLTVMREELKPRFCRFPVTRLHSAILRQSLSRPRRCCRGLIAPHTFVFLFISALFFSRPVLGNVTTKS